MYEYLIILPAVFLYMAYRKYKKGNLLASMVLAFYGFGGICSFLMTQHKMFRGSLNYGYQGVALGAVIYLVVGYIMLMWPILKSRPTYNLDVNYPYKTLFWIAFISAVFGLVYCILSIPYIQLALTVSDFERYKQGVLGQGGLDVAGDSHLLRLIFYLQNVIRPFLTFLFCFVLAKYPRKTSLILLMGFAAMVPPIFNSLGAAHRNIVVFLAFELVVGYLIFYKYYNRRIKRFFYIMGGIAIVMVGAIMVAFTIMRFSSGGSAFLEYSVLRYMGEPFVDFNTMLWGTEDLMYGNKSFPLVREFLGLEAIDQESARLFSAKYIAYFFYGVIGNLYMDFGPVWPIVIVGLTGFIFNKLINRRNPHNPLMTKMLLFLYTVTTMKNYFYFEFLGGSNIRLIWLVLLFCLFQMMLQPKRRRSQPIYQNQLLHR